jgi:serine/threonine protein kinase
VPDKPTQAISGVGLVEEQLISEVLHDRYCIKSLLGRQTGRRTFLAIDRQTQQFVVVKLLLFGVDFDWDDFKLFEREAAVLKSLHHPAIPQYRCRHASG